MRALNLFNPAPLRISQSAITLIASLTLVCSTRPASAQSIQPIYSFTNNANPFASLTLAPDGNFYGTTYEGGSNFKGTVFRITTNGALTMLVTFDDTNGAYPEAALTLGPDGNIYGTTTYGGPDFMTGTIFRMTTNGALTTLAIFGFNNQYPIGGMALGPDGNFYGTTVHGGAGDYGTVFRITTNGELTTLASFASTNGAQPYAGLTLGPDGNFYGTTDNGGNANDGTVFRVTTNGEVTELASLDYTIGAHPYAGLTVGPDGNFYGTTIYGGLPTIGEFPSGYGTIFRITTNGTLTTLAEFANTNGENPFATLTLGPDGNLYGTTFQGIGSGGTVFRITTNGALTTLATFAFTNGANPYNGLTLGPDGNFYGTTFRGGSGDNGVIYRLNLPPSVITQPSNEIVSPGRRAIFTVTVFGSAPFGYQWFYNDAPITGATNSTLTIAHVKPSSAGDYQVIVTNPYGSATSDVASLTVQPGPNF